MLPKYVYEYLYVIVDENYELNKFFKLQNYIS